MLARLAIFALLYWMASRLGLWLGSPPYNIAAIWPASGIALAFMLLTPRRDWGLVLATIFAVNLFTDLSVGYSLAVSAGFALANTLEPALGAWLMRRLCPGRITFGRLREVLALLVVAVLANALTALVGAAVPALAFGADFLATWKTWWIEDAISILLLTPLIVAWATDSKRLLSQSPAHILEAALLLLGLALLTLLIFWPGMLGLRVDVRPYALLPLLAWAALRFNPRGAATALVFTATLILYASTHAAGRPLLGGTTTAEKLVAAQSYLFFTGLTILLIAAIFAERKAAEEDLAGRERRFRALVEHGADAFGLLKSDGTLIYEGPTAARLSGYTDTERLNRSGLELVHPDDLAKTRAVFARVIAEPGCIQTAEFRSIRKDGSIWYTEASAVNLLHEPGVEAVVVNYRDITGRKLAEQALAASERKYRTLVESAEDGIILTDLAGRQLFANPAFAASLGYSPDDLPDPDGFSRVHPDDVQALKLGMQLLLEQGKATAEYRVRHKDGRWIVRLSTSSLVHDDSGSPQAILSIIRDITATRQAQTALEERNREIVWLNDMTRCALQAGSLPETLQVVIDSLSEFLEANCGCLALLDSSGEQAFVAAQSPAKAVGANPLETTLLTRAALQASAPLWIDHASASPLVDLALQERLQDNSLLALPLQSGSLRLGAALLGFEPPRQGPAVGLHRCEQAADQAGLVLARIRLQEQAERKAAGLQALFDFSAAMRAIQDRREIPPVVLNHLEQLFQAGGAALTTALSNQRCLVDSAVGRWEAFIGQSVSGGLTGDAAASQPQLAPFEAGPVVTNHAEVFPDIFQHTLPSLASALLITESGQSLGRLWIGRERPFSPDDLRLFAAVADICANAMQRLALYNDLQEQLDRLQKTQARMLQSEKLAAIGELVAGVAHELNNPLTSVVLNAQLLEMHDPPQDQLRILERIGQDASRAVRIVQGLLGFARQRPVEQVPVNIQDTLQSTLDLLHYELITRNVSVENSLELDLPPTLADPHQIQQVFVNIINNACQALQAQGGGHLRIHTGVGPSIYNLAGPDAPRVIRVTFRDDGPGIPADLLNRIFDPFFTTKQPGQGTGLGLSICHGIITEHNGHIWAESEPGCGAAFIIELPPLTQAAPAASLPVNAAPDLSVIKPSDRPQASLLIVDDEPSILDAVYQVFSGQGFRVVPCASARQALDQLSASGDPPAIDLILCDLRMPEMDGIEFFRVLQQRYPSLAHRIMFATGDSVSQGTQEFLESNQLPYLAKPFHIHDLVSRAQEMLAGPP